MAVSGRTSKGRGAGRPTGLPAERYWQGCCRVARSTERASIRISGDIVIQACSSAPGSRHQPRGAGALCARAAGAETLDKAISVDSGLVRNETVVGAISSKPTALFSTSSIRRHCSRENRYITIDSIGTFGNWMNCKTRDDVRTNTQRQGRPYRQTEAMTTTADWAPMADIS